MDEFDSHIKFSEPLVAGPLDLDANREKLMGTCILPMPDLEPSAYSFCEGGKLGRDCSCLDQGSIECTTKHVMEARNQLRENLGQKIFEELGFCDMGEDIANKWSEDEEQTFHDVVLPYLASPGKNFWDHLWQILPFQTKKDLVSYYFNAFMLQKRAEQNRFDPLNIDSDNDQWQGRELGFTEEEDDSGGASQIEQIAFVYDQQSHKEDCPEDGQDKDGRDDAVLLNHSNACCKVEGDVDDVLETQLGYSNSDCHFYSDFMLPDMIARDNSPIKSFSYQRDG